MLNRSIMMTKKWFLLLIGIVIFYSPYAWAENAADFYKGKTITLIPSSGAGAATDVLSRAAAQYLGEAIDVKVKVENMARNKGLNYVFSQAKPDGALFLRRPRSGRSLSRHLG